MRIQLPVCGSGKKQTCGVASGLGLGLGLGIGLGGGLN